MLTFTQLRDLVEELDSYDIDPDTEIKVTIQPSWPLSVTLGDSFVMHEGSVYLTEEDQIGYTSSLVIDAFSEGEINTANMVDLDDVEDYDE